MQERTTTTGERRCSLAAARIALGDVVNRAIFQGPIVLTRYGEARAVLLGVADYERLCAGAEARASVAHTPTSTGDARST